MFSSPVMYKVETESQRELGSLEQSFVDRLVQDLSTFLLGGRAWMVVGIRHEDRLVRVKPAPRGKKPSWGGFLPQFLGYEICQAMKEVLASDDDYPFLDGRAKAALDEWRADFGALLRSREPMQSDGDAVHWWTFAGGRINQTLKYALDWKGGWKVVPDNFSLRIQGDGLSVNAVRAVIDGVSWSDSETRRALLARVPEYRLSKFQRVLPDKWQVEMVGAYLLDFDGAGRMDSAMDRS